MDEALAMVYEVYQSAGDLILRKYGVRALSADEGGLAPDFHDAEQMLEDTVEAIRAAGFQPGTEVAIAIDVASSHFYHDGFYRMGEDLLTSEQMVEYYLSWIERYPILSLEDALAEEDWLNWKLLRRQLGEKVLVLGDDFLCTNPARILKAIEQKAANALLLKVNQIGTVTEAMRALRLARSAGWQVTISARSGETEDHWLADLAVGWSGDQIKIGSITQSERLAKYNRLLEIEQESGLPLLSWRMP
jgi:enolase